MIGAFYKERKGMVIVDEWTVGGASGAGLLTALLLWLRRRRKGGPRLHVRLLASFRTHASNPTHSTEPPPFPDTERPPKEPHDEH